MLASVTLATDRISARRQHALEYEAARVARVEATKLRVMRWCSALTVFLAGDLVLVVLTAR